MTYPQPGYQGPMHIDPRYAPAPQPQYPPQGQPPAGYGQPYPPQQQPPQGGAALSQPAPKLSTGGGNAGGSWPKMRHLQGCTLIFVPIRVDEDRTIVVNRPGGVKEVVSQPEAYFHLIVVDSPNGVIQYGDSQDNDNPKPLAWERATPCMFTNVNDYGWGPVNEIRNALAAGEAARVGVVERGTQGNKPYMITKPDKMVGGADRPDGQDRYMRAAQIWDQAFAALNGNPAAFANPEPRALLAPPTQPQQQVAYGQPQQPQYAPAMQGVQPGYVPTPYGQAPAGAVHPEYAAAAQQPGAQLQQGYAAGGTTYEYPPQPQYAVPPVTPPGPPQSAPPAPTGYPQGYGQFAPLQTAQPPQNPAFEAYIASLAPEQQAQARAQFAAQQQGGAPAAGGPGI